jgi:hypothetical protein
MTALFVHWCSCDSSDLPFHLAILPPLHCYHPHSYLSPTQLHTSHWDGSSNTDPPGHITDLQTVILGQNQGQGVELWQASYGCITLSSTGHQALSSIYYWKSLVYDQLQLLKKCEYNGSTIRWEILTECFTDDHRCNHVISIPVRFTIA